MFKYGKKYSNSLVVTSGTLFSTLMVYPSTSVVTNAAKESKYTGISDTLWWVFTFGTFGIYAIYYYFFKDPNKELPTKEEKGHLPVSNNNKDDNKISNTNKELKKDQLKLQSADEKAEVSENKKVVQGFKEKLKEAKKKREELAGEIESLEKDMEKDEKQMKELPHKMVLTFNEKAKDFNNKIKTYRNNIETYKKNNKDKIQKLEEKLPYKNKKGEEIAIDVAVKGGVYKLMKDVENEFLKPIDIIDENILDEKLDFKSYEKEAKKIDAIRCKWRDFELFEQLLIDRAVVFRKIKKDNISENKATWSNYDKNYQKNRLQFMDLKEKLSKVDEEISELEASLKIYEKKLGHCKKVGNMAENSINQGNTDVV